MKKAFVVGIAVFGLVIGAAVAKADVTIETDDGARGGQLLDEGVPGGQFTDDDGAKGGQNIDDDGARGGQRSPVVVG